MKTETVFNVVKQTILCDRNKSLLEVYSEAVEQWMLPEYNRYPFPFLTYPDNIKCSYVIKFKTQ